MNHKAANNTPSLRTKRSNLFVRRHYEPQRGNPRDRCVLPTMGLAMTALLSFLTLLAPAAQACSVCFGDPRSNQTKAVLAGILFLLALISTVLSALVITIVRFQKRSHALSTAASSASGS
ncbi:MAG: hypothetical protein EXS63_00110 [Candidatus Omnitrophica bacterium]|nr:hypothetical protein [Candidatus Omnitrophota bacterium]